MGRVVRVLGGEERYTDFNHSKLFHYDMDPQPIVVPMQIIVPFKLHI